MRKDFKGDIFTKVFVCVCVHFLCKYTLHVCYALNDINRLF